MREESILFGKIVIQNHLASEEQVRHCLEKQLQYRQRGIEKEIGEIFVEEGILSPEQVKRVLEAQKLSLQIRRDTILGKLALRQGWLSEQQWQEVSQILKQSRYRRRAKEVLLEKHLLSELQLQQLEKMLEKYLSTPAQQKRGYTEIVKRKEVQATISQPASTSVAVEEKNSAKETGTVSEELTEGSSTADDDLDYEELFIQKALAKGWIQQAQIEECRHIQKTMAAMGIEKSLDQILLDKKYISPEQKKELEAELPIRSPIEGYICEAKVGEGAMGTVYKARLKGSPQVVALKVLHPDYSEDKEYLRRFIREAQAARELEHPNLVKAYDVGVSGDFFYYSMEFVDGPTIREIVDESGPIPEEKVVEYALQVTSALQCAWEHNIVHRDIKPENIMIDRHSGQAKLCDLGIAKRLDQDLSLTQPGMAVGTPYYISPEQARGDQVDIRSDIYSLGATLFHALTGTVPYDGETATQILLKHVTAPIPLACEKKPDISVRFSKIIAKMMAKTPEERYQNPEELMAELHKLQEKYETGEGLDEAPTEQNEIPSPIEGYRIRRVLGQGAMGIVYEAIDSSGQQVALKVLLPHVAEDEEFLRRFLLEARKTMEINHPNIIKAYDVGVSGDYFYYAMEFVDGVSVKTLMEDRGGKLDVPLALDITRQVAQALVHAWEHRIVHRDIKPENIMYTRKGEAKLCDLGIAKNLSDDKGLTQPGMAVGSPYYIAPEQARGKKVDTRSDIYSLGATLFHMVTGTVPFEGRTAAAVMAMHVRSPVPNPREREPSLPVPVAKLIQKMMAKAPEERYQSPAELIAAIDRIQL